VPELEGVTLGVDCSDELSMADACAVAAVMRGAGEVKAAAYPVNRTSLAKLVKILRSKEDVCQVYCATGTTEMKRITDQIRWMCETGRSRNSAFDDGVRDDAEGITLGVHDSLQDVIKAAAGMGYDLSEEDSLKVYEEFQRIASKKGSVGRRELDTIIASTALQVPSTYVLDSYVINSGNIMTATAFLKISKNEQQLESVTIGDGPIDAAFLAIEKITGQHYELDDFQIQTVTEGRDAMGEAIVKLRHDGKIYSGRGISTDIIGSSIRAYINALNKIVYEEQG
jgi:2-isopropylmalate synthase